MTYLKATSGMIVASVALTLAIVPRVFASSHSNVTVSGNGSGSIQNVSMSASSNDTVNQSNATMVMTIQTANASTGNNGITGTTGSGGNMVMTGSAMSSNAVSAQTGENVAMANSCGCQHAGSSVNISGNGSNSRTTVTMTRASTRNMTQRTRTNVFNDQQSNAGTENNGVTNTTGSGMNMVQTGSATTTNHVSVQSGSNIIGN